jgi:hypothetical protein
VLVTGAVALFATSSLCVYFVDFSPQRRAGGPHAELATEVAPMIDDLAETHDVRFLGSPHVYWEFATFPYLAPRAVAVDVTEELEAPPSDDLLARPRGTIFLVHPARTDEVELLETAYPGHARIEIRSGADDGALLGTLYVVPPDG